MIGVVVMLSIFVSLLQRYYNLFIFYFWLEEVKMGGLSLPKVIYPMAAPQL